MTGGGGVLPHGHGASSLGTLEGKREGVGDLCCAQGVGITTGLVDFFFGFFAVETGILNLKLERLGGP